MKIHDLREAVRLRLEAQVLTSEQWQLVTHTVDALGFVISRDGEIVDPAPRPDPLAQRNVRYAGMRSKRHRR